MLTGVLVHQIPSAVHVDFEPDLRTDLERLRDEMDRVEVASDHLPDDGRRFARGFLAVDERHDPTRIAGLTASLWEQDRIGELDLPLVVDCVLLDRRRSAALLRLCLGRFVRPTRPEDLVAPEYTSYKSRGERIPLAMQHTDVALVRQGKGDVGIVTRRSVEAGGECGRGRSGGVRLRGHSDSCHLH